MPHDHYHAPGEHCAICEGQGTFEERLLAHIERCKVAIRECGWVIQAVTGNPPFGYSVGMVLQGTPEIIMVGFHPHIIHGLINHVGMLMTEEGHRFTDWSQSTEVIARFPVCFRELTPDSIDEHCAMLENICGPDHRVLQLFLPDMEGRFPWEADCRPAFMAQYALGLGYKAS